MTLCRAFFTYVASTFVPNPLTGFGRDLSRFVLDIVLKRAILIIVDAEYVIICCIQIFLLYVK